MPQKFKVYPRAGTLSASGLLFNGEGVSCSGLEPSEEVSFTAYGGLNGAVAA